MGLGKTYSTKYLLDSNNSSGVAGQVLSTTSTGIDWVDANTVPGTGLWLASGNNIYNSNSANVGIGTTSPLALLSVGSGSLADTNVAVQISTSGGTSQKWFGVNKNGSYGLLMGYLEGGSIGDGGAGAYIRNITEDPLYFMVSNSDLAMTILANKNVGIGDTSPGTKLTIKQVDDTFNDLDLLQLKRVWSTASGSDRAHGITFNDTNSTLAKIYADRTNSGSNYNSDLVFITNTGASGTNTSEKMRITNSGNVGIGITNPAVPLDVEGKIRSNDNSSGDYLEIFCDGSVSGDSYIENTNNNIQIKSAFATSFSTSGSVAMFIKNNQNVGIGTTSPSHKLEIGLTSGVALSSQPAIPLLVSNNGESVDGRVFIQVKNDIVNTASAVGAGFQMTAAGVTSGTASYENSLIFLQSKAPGNQTIHSAPQNIKFYVDNDGTAAGTGANYNDFGDLAFELQADGEAIFNYNVGIGETNPAVPLHVSRDNTAQAENIALILDNNATEDGTQIGMLFRCMTGGANTDFEIYGEAQSSNTMDLVFESDGSVERMRLKADGDLQIARYLEHLNDTNSYLGWSAGDDFRIVTGGRELLRLDEGTDPDVLNFMTTNFSMSTGGELKLLNNGGAKIIFSGNGANPTSTEASIYDQSGVGLTLSAHNVSIRNYDGTNMIESARFVHDKLTCAGDVIGYGSPSDVRLKENIKPIKSALDKVSKLQGVTFDWKKSDSILDIKEDIGFIAQDVQEVLPELVRENSDGMLSMRHQGITPILLEAIKELKAEIEDLKKKIK